MIVQQTQNAFNDKAAQFLLVPLGGAIGYTLLGAAVESWATIFIALPFVLFAPLAGWLSDRFSKRDVMFGAAIAQLLILSWLCGAIWLNNMPLALCGFFALAIQSAFFSPAKIGINKELVGSRHLGFAAGIQQMTAMLAILAGQIIAGVVYDKRYAAAGGTPDVAWETGLLPMLVLAALAIPAIIMAWIVPRTPAQGAAPLAPKIAVEHFTHLRELWADLPLRRASFAVAFFWGFATFINLWSVKLAKTLTLGQEGFGTLSSVFMAGASIGMAAGFGIASFLLRRRIELGWVPLGGVAMTITAALLAAFIDPTTSLALLDAEALGIGPLIAAVFRPSSGAFLWGLTLLAFFAALFLAPLNAWMQDRYPPKKRGEMQSAVNLQDCLAGIFAAAFVEGLAAGIRAIGLPDLPGYHIQLLAAALLCGFITWYIVRLMPGDLVRVIGLTLLGLFYRIRPVGADNMPKTGGVLLLPNHVTWADAFFITAASPRPVRFVMDAVYMENPAIRWFCKLFHTVPIALGKPREALRTASEALAAGDVICLFPEGQLTRTGTLREVKRGLELIARQGGAPVIPAWLDGAWGSIFSYERNRFFTKLPYRVPYGMRMAFGTPIEPKEARIGRIRDGILEASADAIESRLPHWKSDPHQTANGYQIAQVNALVRKHAFARLPDDPEVDALTGLTRFSEMFRAKPAKFDDPADEKHRIWVGGSRLREKLTAAPARDEAHSFYDFSPDAHLPLELAGWDHLPCLAIDGVVISMSMPHSAKPHASSSPQPGVKPGSLGILLPGFAIDRSDEGRITLRGPSTPSAGIPLPDGYTIDEEGFVFPPQA
ncbi:lysophospholipid transporter LplT [Haloferula helveola]|uniref:Lysophospholipid transporter LplT n=2 Tax=Haloferula helveola TaxID=490095 RepID=A0ABM7RMB8_9BACT|nr:lysophospholipid transporter LplT [Haloferula helveola]